MAQNKLNSRRIDLFSPTVHPQGLRGVSMTSVFCRFGFKDIKGRC
jgi:hypothetical protein